MRHGSGICNHTVSDSVASGVSETSFGNGWCFVRSESCSGRRTLHSDPGGLVCSCQLWGCVGHLGGGGRIAVPLT